MGLLDVPAASSGRAKSLEKRVGRLSALNRRKPAIADGTKADATVTIQTAATSGETEITSPVSYVVDYGTAGHVVRFTSCGTANPVLQGAGYIGSAARSGTYSDVIGPSVYDTMVSDPDGTIELMLQSSQTGGQFIRLYIDDICVLDWRLAPASFVNTQRYRVKIIRGSNRSNTMHLRAFSNLAVVNVKTGPHGKAWFPTLPIYNAVALGIGDSYMGGAQDPAYTGSFGGYFGRLCEAFRLDGRRAAQSSTGLTTVGTGGGKTTFVNRIGESKTYAATDCDFGILQLSVNDGGQTQSAITTAMQSFVTAWRANYGSRPIFVIGVARGIPTGPSTANCDAIDNGAIAVMNANPDLFPYPLVPTTGWWTGDGYDTHAATTTPKGTTELGIASDGLHPTAVGHDYMADRIADYLGQFLALNSLVAI